MTHFSHTSSLCLLRNFELFLNVLISENSNNNSNRRNWRDTEDPQNMDFVFHMSGGRSPRILLSNVGNYEFPSPVSLNTLKTISFWVYFRISWGLALKLCKVSLRISANPTLARFPELVCLYRRLLDIRCNMTLVNLGTSCIFLSIFPVQTSLSLDSDLLTTHKSFLQLSKISIVWNIFIHFI